jgi:pimeloyl-ACP methyl ester carboxylesterase
MIFFSGFTFKNEEDLFKKFLKNSQFTVAGFSYGSILAVEHVLKSKERVDTLQLFSPAFFNNKSEKFKRLQLISFRKDRDSYRDIFVKNSFFPRDPFEISRKNDEIEDLEKLLYFQWSSKDLEKLKDRGVKIEVFLGEMDKIVDSREAYDFFKPYSTIYFIKGVGHTLN